jgi:Ca2+-binding EF-hand superfamily protein
MYFANYFDLREEKKRLFKYFSIIDKDHNGMITFDELIDAFSFRVSGSSF